jgi:CRISPR/Cas system CMR subunit Cmr6 (Cas7 group RAMP superfamily)
MDTQLYIRQVLTEHLLSADYKQLTETEARQIMGNVTETLKKLITEYKETLSKAEYTFFQQNIHSYHRIPIFYGLPKVHKTPVTLRPVVSGSNSFLGIFSTWLDFKMKLLLPYVKSFIKNSAAVIQDIKQLPLPPHALLFSADATAMYIETSCQLICSN